MTTFADPAVDVDAATDVERMAAVIGLLLSPIARVASAEVVDHKEGRRALVRYQLDGPGPARTRTLLAKLYPDPIQAERVHDLMARLDHDVFAAAPGLGVPRVLGWSADPALVLYRPAVGGGIDDAPDEDRRVDAVVRAARWLARLHGCHLELDRRLDPGHEAANAVAWAETAGLALPGIADRVAAVAASLPEAVAGVAVRSDVPIHKDFHHQHLVLGPDHLDVVDLDEARLGDPAFDLAHFVVNLELRAIRAGRPPSDDPLVAAFLGAYRAETGWTTDDRFDLFARTTAVKVVKQLAVGSGLHPRPTGAERDRQADLVLAGAEARARTVGSGDNRPAMTGLLSPERGRP